MLTIIITAIIVSIAAGTLIGLLIGATIAAGQRADYERRHATMRHAIRQVLLEATEQHDDTRQITEATFHRLLKINAEQ